MEFRLPLSQYPRVMRQHFFVKEGVIAVTQNRSEESSVLIRVILVNHATKHLIRDFMILGLGMVSGKGRGKRPHSSP